jgi:glycosyltransferase involved in cell wall biosynthesis
LTALIIYAPGVWRGGGAVLLQQLIESLNNNKDVELYLDCRFFKANEISINFNVKVIKNTILGRILGEILLKRSSEDKNPRVLCFHGLPPIFRLKSYTKLYLQNINYVRKWAVFDATGRTKYRLFLERFLFALFAKNVDEFLVQSTHMHSELFSWSHRTKIDLDNKSIKIMPFANKVSSTNGANDKSYGGSKKHNFLYVADSEGHKNHKNLLLAWGVLRDLGFTPSLCLTISYDDLKIIQSKMQQIKFTNVVCLPNLSRNEMVCLYKSSKFLIYPSLGESFGLPLIEAQEFNLPIVGAHLPYMTELCSPIKFFDPRNPYSIAQAVIEVLQNQSHKGSMQNSSEFINSLLEQNEN